ncbi:MAG TPA: polyprenyl synthetase family protein [candidate division Zixibacteria bacterium]|nr:polyprenyl synthetase family protein [candidate division Zixibacteria bacterium]
MAAIDGRQYLADSRELTNRLLRKYLPAEDREPTSLHKAMRYSALADGKRLRPTLCLAAYEFCGGNADGEDLPVHFAMAALEMVHAYSLIHDDLPCMDDDDLRRGIPTCHKQFGEAMAVLAGDALHVAAFELMTRTESIEAIRELAEAVDTEGMLGGQVADIEAEGRDSITLEEVVNIHRRKTGALLRGSVRIGAILAGAEPGLLERLTSYAEKIGLAFQIVDDILDVVGDEQLLGKDIGSDSKNQKATYPAAVGLDRARKDARDLIRQAEEALGDKAGDNMLTYIARFIGQRDF